MERRLSAAAVARPRGAPVRALATLNFFIIVYNVN